MNLEELGPSWQKQNDCGDRLSANMLTGVIRRAERERWKNLSLAILGFCLLYTSPSPRDKRQSRMPSSA